MGQSMGQKIDDLIDALVDVISTKVLWISIDDWAGLYFKNDCVYQGHDISILHMKVAIPVDFKFSDVDIVDLLGTSVYKEALDYGRLPDTRREVIEVLTKEIAGELNSK